jgi:nicotinate phosphoribosyltransferase
MGGDVLSEDTDSHAGDALIRPAMRSGRRCAPSPTLAEARANAASQLDRLPEPLRRLERGASYPVEVAESLVRLAEEVDRRTQSELVR